MKTRTKILFPLGILLIGGGIAWFSFRSSTTTQDIHYFARPVGYTDISATVQETGTINPVDEVQVGTEVSGTILAYYVDFNDKVKKGQILCKIDPTNYQAAVDSSRASLRLAQANEHSSEVGVGKAKAELGMANLTYERDNSLLTQNLINQNQVDLDRTAAVSAQQDYLSSQAAVESAKAQIAVVQAQLSQSEYSLSKTVIRSPIDGIVLNRAISVGQTVAASLQTPTLFTLASSLADMQVDTSVDEADAGNVHEGAQARITVTAYPNVTFPGTVSQLRVNPTVVSNVVTYDAVVRIHDKSGRLLPGMTAQVTVEATKKTHVLAVPLAALLFNPSAAPIERPSGFGGAFGGGFGGGGGGNRGGGFSAGVVQTQGTTALAGAPGSRVTLWLLREGKPVATVVTIGISDGHFVEITDGQIQAGDPVILAQRRGNAAFHPRDGNRARSETAP